MIKKPSRLALFLLLLIPLVTLLGGTLFSLINPEIAAGHPNYVRNFRLLTLLKITSWWVACAGVAALWLLVCLLVIRSKKRSYFWLFLALLGPVGFAILAMLSDRTPAETGGYAEVVRKLNGLLHIGYELCTFALVWPLAYEAIVLKRLLIIRYQAAATGMSIAQIINLQNASGGMWAFSEGMEVMYLVVLFYLLRPVLFNIVDYARGRFSRI
jgi:hypothetical protein